MMHHKVDKKLVNTINFPFTQNFFYHKVNLACNLGYCIFLPLNLKAIHFFLSKIMKLRIVLSNRPSQYWRLRSQRKTIS